MQTEWMSVLEAAEYLRVPSRGALYQLVSRFQLPAYRVGGPRKGNLIFSRTDLDEFIRARRVVPNERKRRSPKPS